MSSHLPAALRWSDRALRGVWWWLRQVTGDAAYENYLRSAQRGKAHNCARAGVLSPQEFYLAAVEHRARGVNRCC